MDHKRASQMWESSALFDCMCNCVMCMHNFQRRMFLDFDLLRTPAVQNIIP